MRFREPNIFSRNLIFVIVIIVSPINMDIQKLISTVKKLNIKLSDVDQKVISRKQELDNVNRAINQAQQQLEQKVVAIASIIKNKHQELENLSQELSNRQSLLAEIQGNVPSNAANDAKYEAKANNNVKSENTPQNSDRSVDLFAEMKKQASLEDYIKSKFEKEYGIEYPNSGQALDDKNFNLVLEKLIERAKQNNNLPEAIEDYLSNYSKTLNNQQVEEMRKKSGLFKK